MQSIAWWLEGVTSRHFGWVRNPSEAIFSYFWSQGKNWKKIRNFFSQEKSGFFRKKSVFIGNIDDFSPIFLLPIFPPENLFQHHRKPIFRRKIGRKKRFFCPCLKPTEQLQVGKVNTPSSKNIQIRLAP